MALNAKSERRSSTSSDEFRSTRAPDGASGVSQSLKSAHNSNPRVSFSVTPDRVFDTYSSKEYERKDGETDPLTASVVFQLEKLADSLDAFDVVLNKGDGGLGFSIVGMGFGDNLGPVDKLSICIKQILDQGTAQKDGRIQPGDQIIEVNGKSMVGVTYQEAVDILKNVTGRVSLRMGRRRLDGGSIEGPPQRQLVQMGVSSQGSSTSVGHQITGEVAKKTALATHATLQGPSITVGHQSGQINDDHRESGEMAKKATLITHATLQGSSFNGHQSGHGQISDDHKLTGDAAKKATLIGHATHQGLSATVGHHGGQINADHGLTGEVAKKTTLTTTHATLHGSSAIDHHGHINDDHRLTGEVAKKAPVTTTHTSVTTTHTYTRRDSSSDEEKARKRHGSDSHGIDELQSNSSALMLKLELASIKRKELERQLEVIRAEVDGVLRQRSSDGSGEKSDRIKLIEVEATLAKARREADRMKVLRDDSERQIDELDKRLRSEIRLMHETHSTSLQVIEKYRSNEREHDTEKESIKRRLCDMDQQYEKQIHTLTEKIRHLEVRFSGSYDEVDLSHVTPGIALAVNHANDRSPTRDITKPSFQPHSLPGQPVVTVKTRSHSSDSDSDDGRRKLVTSLPLSSSGPAHAHSLKTDSVVSIHSPAKKSTETSSSMTAIVKSKRHSDSDMDVVFDDAPPDYAPPPVPDDDSSDSDKATPTVLQVNRNEKIADDRHRMEIEAAVRTTFAGQRLLEKRPSVERKFEGHGHLEGSKVHEKKLGHGSSSDEGEHSKIGVRLESDKHLKKDQFFGKKEGLRERESSDEEGHRKALIVLERENSSDDAKTAKKIERIESFDSQKRINISDKTQKAGHEANSSDDERSRRKLGLSVGAYVLASGTSHSSETRNRLEADGRRLSVESRHSDTSGRDSENGESTMLGVKSQKDHSLERSKMSDDNSDKEGKSQKKDKKTGNKKLGLFWTRKKRNEAAENEEETDDESDDNQTKVNEETKAKKGKLRWGKKRKDEDNHEYDSDEDIGKKSSKNEKARAKEEAKLKKAEKKKAKADAKKKSKENDGITFPAMGVAVALNNTGDISSSSEVSHSASKKNKKVLSKDNEGIIYPAMGVNVALKKQGEISSEEESSHSASKKNKKVLSKDSGGLTFPVMGVGVAVQNQGEISSSDEFKHSTSMKEKNVLSRDTDGITYPVIGVKVALEKQRVVSSDDEFGHSSSKKSMNLSSKDSDGIKYPVMGGAIAMKKQGDISSDDEFGHSSSKKSMNLSSKDSDGIKYPVMGGAIAMKKQGDISSDDEFGHSSSKKSMNLSSKDSDGIKYPVMGGAIAMKKQGDISSDDEFGHSSSKKSMNLSSKDSDGIKYPVMGGAIAMKKQGDISSDDEFGHSSSKKSMNLSSKDSDGIKYPVMGGAIAMKKQGDFSSDDELGHSVSQQNRNISSKDSDGIKYPVMGGAIAMKKQGDISSDEESKLSASTKKKKVLTKDSEGISYPAMGIAVALEKQGDISSSEEFNHSTSEKNKKVLSKQGSGGITFPVMGLASAVENKGDISSSDEFKQSAYKADKKVIPRDNDGIAYPVMGIKVSLENKGEITSSGEFSHSTLKRDQNVLLKESDGITYPAMGIAVALEKHGDVSSEDELDHSDSKKNKKLLSRDNDGISYPVMAGAAALKTRGDISSDDEFGHSAKKKTVSSKDNDGITYPVLGIGVAVEKRGEAATTNSASSLARPDVKIASRIDRQRDSDDASLGSRGSSSSKDNVNEGHDPSRPRNSLMEVHRTLEVSFRPWKSTPDVSGNRDTMMTLSSYPGMGSTGRMADQWSTEEVANWLISINLGELIGVFERHSVDGMKLLTLSTNSFKEMEISGKNKDLLKKKIKELHSAIAKVKKLREKEEKLREKEEKAQAKLRKKEASKKKSSKKQLGSDAASVGSRASTGSKDDDDYRDHSRSPSSHLEGQGAAGANIRPWKSTSDVSSGLMMSFSSYPSSSGQMESTGPLADQWSTEEVASWLVSINLGELIGVFERHSVDGKKLLTLSTNSFKDMEIDGKTKDLLKKKIKELQSAIAKEKKLREKEEKLREKEEKAQEKLRKKEASKNK